MMNGIKYSFSGLVQDHAKVHEVTDELQKDANEDEQRLVEALNRFTDEVLGEVFSQDQEGKFSVDVSGEVKHDGAALTLHLSVRRTVLPHQNALDGSASAFPPTASEARRKEERITRTRRGENDAPLPAVREGEGRYGGPAVGEQVDREPPR
jgi:hypothetical protein